MAESVVSNYSVAFYGDNRTSEDEVFYTVTDEYLLLTFYAAISVTGVVLNTFTIFMLSAKKRAGGDLKIQLINVSVADLVTSLFYPIYLAVILLHYPFPSNLALCRFLRIAGLGAHYTSLLWNVAISIELFVVIYFPFKACLYTKKHKILVAGLVWLAGYTPRINVFLYARLISQGSYQYCIVHSPLSLNYPDVYFGVRELTYIVPTMIPTAIIITMYSLIAIKFARRKIIGQEVESKASVEKLKQQNSKVYRMLAITAAVTIVTWTPFCMAASIMQSIGYENYTKRQRFAINAVLAGFRLTKCFTSPIVYYVSNDRFKKYSIEFLRRICNRKYCIIPQSLEHTSNSFKNTSSTQNITEESTLNGTDRHKDDSF